MNLAVNARDAMPKGGRLTIETANVESTRRTRAATSALRPGRYVMLAVSDTGIGMDEETQRASFEPFFTTKEHGKGHRARAGDGLRHRQAERRRTSWVYSELGQGHDLQGLLPGWAEAVIGPRRPERCRRRHSAGTETVLVVEDEDGGSAADAQDSRGSAATGSWTPERSEAEALFDAHQDAIRSCW